MTLLERLSAQGPKRILALDGGGIRGALTLGYLMEMEKILRERHGNKGDFRLCDYFDLIGGTSTGSIIAACLAIGMTVQEIRDKYFELGGRIFNRKYKWYKIFEIDDLIKASYDHRPLEEELQKVFGDITLGDQTRIRTGLCIVAKRADTNSVWPLINHPKGKFFSSEMGKNSEIPLWMAVRASAAAPTYFLPQVIDVGGDLPEAAFVDGGVSMANNPALQLLMVATLSGFPFHWEWGDDRILIVSVGTGMSRWSKLPKQITKNHLLNWAASLPDMLMQDASWHNQLILQWLSHSRTPLKIDSEIGVLAEDLIAKRKTDPAYISYLRYNTWLTKPDLDALMGKNYDPKKIDDLVEMSNADSRFELYDIGAKAASVEIKPEHFPAAFNLS
ncbi:MAG: patatin-like phospholipase family protein [Chitinophagaceae bacterium]|jgi:patatin-like phospholipase/acyl hydrolase|nr:patatin-like phospholipase family protein [Chitinophagaceae bacterium]